MNNIFYALVIGTFVATSAMAADMRPILPDHTLTPGVADPAATKDKLCVDGYSSTVRNVSEATKKKVFAEYGIDPKSDKYEIDHLISLENGGSNNMANLWPESYDTLPWNAHVKDKLENEIHKSICDGSITIEDAQKKLSGDWISSYCSIYDDKKEECAAYLNTVQ